MKIQLQCLLLIPLFSSVAMLSGCASPGKNMIPVGGDKTMPEIYKEEVGLGIKTPSGVVSDKHSLSGVRSEVIGPQPKVHYVAYTATANNQVRNLFKRLPNPEVPVYIFPHLVRVNGESYPKPGVTTGFFLYKNNHFAMPNELY